MDHETETFDDFSFEEQDSETVDDFSFEEQDPKARSTQIKEFTDMFDRLQKEAQKARKCSADKFNMARDSSDNRKRLAHQEMKTSKAYLDYHIIKHSENNDHSLA